MKGCTRNAKPNQFMCWPHWRRVPKALDHDVFDTYRAWAATRRNDPGGTAMAETTAAYRQARDAAIEAVETKEADEQG